MAMDSEILSSAIRQNVLDSMETAIDGDELTRMCDAIAEAVVDHLQTSASVLPTSLVAPTGGGQVTGTGTLT